MRMADVDHRALQQSGRLFDALTDPARRERTIVWVLAAHAAIWTLFGVLANGSQDIHFDMGEMIAWAQETLLTTPNHPPLGPWLVRAWFSVLPYADWSYYLFAILMASTGLWFAWKLSERYLEADRRVVGIALLSIVPFYNFYALRFGATTVLIPFWAATTWWFLRSYETHSRLYAALAGVAAALSMLGKYWSVVLLIGLGIAALSDRRRAEYFRSAAPWVTVAAGLIVLAPHLAGLYWQDVGPIGFAFAKYASPSYAFSLWSAIGYTVGMAGYAAPAVVVAVLMLRPSRASVVDTLWPNDADRRMLMVAFVAPFIAALLVAVAFKVRIVSIWGMAGLALLPILMLSSPKLTVPRDAALRILAFAVCFPIVLTVLAPLIALINQRYLGEHYEGHYRLVAQALDKAWRETTGQPLRLVGGQLDLIYSTAFYLPGRPSTYLIDNPKQSPWADDARVAREGIAIACPVERSRCIEAMERYVSGSPAAKQTELTLVRRYLGTAGAPQRYRIAVIPPRG
jgi:hypothetical protein